MLGKIILDLPPSPGNPRNSEGAMLRLNDGSILFIYSRFCGSDAADDAAADLYALISDDEGEHFHSLGPVVFHAETSAKNVMSVSLLRMENGDIGLFYLERRGETDMRMMLRRSADEGRTWTDPAICMPNSGYYVVNNDRVLRLCSGRILLPAALRWFHAFRQPGGFPLRIFRRRRPHLARRRGKMRAGPRRAEPNRLARAGGCGTGTGHALGLGAHRPGPSI